MTPLASQTHEHGRFRPRQPEHGRFRPPQHAAVIDHGVPQHLRTTALDCRVLQHSIQRTAALERTAAPDRKSGYKHGTRSAPLSHLCTLRVRKQSSQARRGLHMIHMREHSRRQTWPVYASHTRTPTRAANAARVILIHNMEVVIRVYAFARGFTLGRA